MENKDMPMPIEPDMETIFNMLKEKMPMPDEHVKDAVLNALVYVLSM